MSALKDRYQAIMSDKSMNIHATLAEALGTGILVLIGTSAVAHGEDNFTVAVVFGLAYFAVMCATRHHGGAHLNPAITIASMFAGVTGFLQAIAFVVAQVRSQTQQLTAMLGAYVDY